MSSNLMHPPNTNSLSDNVIGAVAVRIAHSRYNNHEICIPAHTSQVATDMAQSTLQQTASVFSSEMGGNDNDRAWDEMTIAERSLMLYRQRRTRTQRKYRKKINDRAIALADSVTQLQEEIQQLEKRRMCCIPSHSLSKTSSWSMIVEYIRLFRHGYKPPTWVANPEGTITTPALDANCVQKSFLQAAMMPDIAFNGGRRGVNAVLEDWKYISQLHENTESQLMSLEYGADGLLIAHMDVTSIVTVNMIRNCLLHLDHDDEHITWSLIAKKLLGQKLVIPVTVRYEWDELNSRFVSIYYEADMLSPLLKLLDNWEDATTVANSVLGSHLRL